MHDGLGSSGIWQDTSELPETLATTVDRAHGFDAVADLIRRPGVRRLVASGNGASYYVAQALWLAALEGERYPIEAVAVPGGLLANGAFRWREGDVLLAISSSGEFRDVIEAVESPAFPRPFALVTSTPESTLGRAADACALVSVPNQRAITHTQAFCGAVLACLAIWARVAGDDDLAALTASAPDLCASALGDTLAWAQETFPGLATPTAAITFGTGPGWAAALENALLVKEVARIPCEGVETREGATAAMTGLLPEHLVLSLPTLDDGLIDEAEQICRMLGAPVLRAPGGERADRRLSPVTTFPAAVALSAELALRAGWSPDNPAWIDTYYLTARRRA
jgi:fructoselysine-6-P-deglycase FrlB-like protein